MGSGTTSGSAAVQVAVAGIGGVAFVALDIPQTATRTKRCTYVVLACKRPCRRGKLYAGFVRVVKARTLVQQVQNNSQSVCCVSLVDVIRTAGHSQGNRKKIMGTRPSCIPIRSLQYVQTPPVFSRRRAAP